MPPPVFNTTGDLMEFLRTIPPTTKLRVYNKDAWEHTPVQASYYGEKSPISITNTLILNSSVHVVVED